MSPVNVSLKREPLMFSMLLNVSFPSAPVAVLSKRLTVTAPPALK